MSYCLVESSILQASSFPIRTPLRAGATCNYLTVTNPGEGVREADKSQLLHFCFLRELERPGDVAPLSREVVKERLACQASRYVQDIDEGSICSSQELEQLTYKQIKDDLPTYNNCFLQHLLKDLTNPNTIEWPIEK